MSCIWCLNITFVTFFIEKHISIKDWVSMTWWESYLGEVASLHGVWRFLSGMWLILMWPVWKQHGPQASTWPQVVSQTMIFIVHTTARGHVDVHGPHYPQRPCWCLWSWLPQETVLISVLSATTRGLVDLCSVVCATAGGYVDLWGLCRCQRPWWGPRSTLPLGIMLRSKNHAVAMMMSVVPDATSLAKNTKKINFNS